MKTINIIDVEVLIGNPRKAYNAMRHTKKSAKKGKYRERDKEREELYGIRNIQRTFSSCKGYC